MNGYSTDNIYHCLKSYQGLSPFTLKFFIRKDMLISLFPTHFLCPWMVYLFNGLLFPHL